LDADPPAWIDCSHRHRSPGKKEIKESHGTLNGNSWATAGLILGYIQIGLVVLAGIAAIVLILVLGANLAA